MTQLNTTLSNMGVYASKTISQTAKAFPDILNLSIGEPEFGPPEHLLSVFESEDLTVENFLDSVKRYEQSRGSPALRQAVANWYQRRYGLRIDPDKEVLITHGGVEAITLAILSTTQTAEPIAVTDPAYMLYARSIATLGRNPISFQRTPAVEEYKNLIETNDSFAQGFGGAKAIIINSPENPSGYVLSKEEWQLLADVSQKNDTWIIHDEVYDTTTFSREHFPARGIDEFGERTIMVNSFSKKFGTPGLRIGWLIANERLIDIAAKAHDYLYLGVNILYERIANRLLSHPNIEAWFAKNNEVLLARIKQATNLLTSENGFIWKRDPMGAMFLFPDVVGLHEVIPSKYKTQNATIGEAVANYLVQERRIASVPGSVYGQQGNNHIRLVTCSPANIYDSAIKRLADLKVSNKL
jgi:aspartate/methionine/tyrosine aminotransferase